MKTPKPDQIVVDDDVLLSDRLIRSLHRNPDGHLHISYAQHKSAIEKDHNVVILYVYTEDPEGGYTVHEHYVYDDGKSHSYREWNRIAQKEALRLARGADKSFYGVYGWTTGFIQITPLRTGDLFIKIDDQGARGVRLTFDSAKNKRAARKGA